MNTKPTQHLVATLAGVLLLLVSCADTGSSDPTAPGDVTATAGPGYVTVTWTDRSDDETGFAVHRSAVSDSALDAQQAVRIGTTGPNETSLIDHGAELATTYRYSVAALGADGRAGTATAAASDATIEPGVDLVVGTIARPDGTFGTAVLLYVFFPQDGVAAEDASVELTGPGGWNGDAVHTRSVAPFMFDAGWGTFPVYGADAVQGAYRVDVTRGSDTFTAEATLDDATFAFPEPQGLTVTEASDARVSVTWDPIPEAVSYIVGIVTTPPYTGVAYEATLANRHTFEGIDLPDLAQGQEYRAELSAWQIDQRPGIEPPPKPDPYGYSIEWLPFSP